MSASESMRWSDQPLAVIKDQLAAALKALEPGQLLEFWVPDPEFGSGRYAGQIWTHQGQAFRHRSYRNWVDLAELLGCRMLTPKPGPTPWIQMRLQKLDVHRASRRPKDETPDQERYGEQSDFYAVQKLEEPCFLQDLQLAYQRVEAQARHRVLDLGVHRGDELRPLAKLWESGDPGQHQCIGIDHCPSAIDQARASFPASQFSFLCEDINNHANWDFEPFDLIVSIGTLQCRGLAGKSIFPALVRRLLAPQGAVILGFPYLRYVDGEVRQGGQMRNYSEAEHALVFKDLLFYRKLLQRRTNQVTITGRYYLFLTAWSSPRRTM